MYASMMFLFIIMGATHGKAPAVRLVDLVLFEALSRGASDVHLQPLSAEVIGVDANPRPHPAVRQRHPHRRVLDDHDVHAGSVAVATTCSGTTPSRTMRWS